MSSRREGLFRGSFFGMLYHSAEVRSLLWSIAVRTLVDVDYVYRIKEDEMTKITVTSDYTSVDDKLINLNTTLGHMPQGPQVLAMTDAIRNAMMLLRQGNIARADAIADRVRSDIAA